MTDDGQGGRPGSGMAAADVPDEALHEVQLLQLPIAIHARAQEHSAELLREMYLIAQQLHGEAERRSPATALPTRLIELVEVLSGQFNPFTAEQDRQLQDAVARQLEEIDLVYHVPLAAAAAAARLGDMLDEADEFCRQGQHLLTLATPPDLLRYRQWFLGEFLNQLGDGPVTPWPQYAATA